MDSMLGEDKNLKDISINSEKETFAISSQSQDTGLRSMSYTKTNKLITALYMVTDIIEKEEPLRAKLRTLGANIISDVCSISQPGLTKKITDEIYQIIAFLGIVSTIGIVSEMNCSILKKEFHELSLSIQEFEYSNQFAGQKSLAEFFLREERPIVSFEAAPAIKRTDISKGHVNTINIGVQKGSTLLKAINDKMSDKDMSLKIGNEKSDFNILKKQRREEIIKIIKVKKEATITDIKLSATGSLVSCGEKTLQRELLSMIKDGILKKTGTKRWSKYSF